MKCFKYLLMAVCVTLSSLTYAAGASKIGVLDIQTLLTQSQMGGTALKTWATSKEFTELSAQIDNYTAELKLEAEKADKEGFTWAEEKKKEHEEKSRGIYMQRQELLSRRAGTEEAILRQTLKQLEPLILVASQKVMEAEGIDILLDSKAVIHATPVADITDFVLVKVNDLYEEEVAKYKERLKEAEAAPKTDAGGKGK